jgi:hypothetical protein
VQVHELGVFIAPGSQKVDNKDTLCSRLAISLAKAGHLVVRAPYEGGGFPQGNMVQKAFEAAVLSPYATGVRQWIFIGMQPTPHSPSFLTHASKTLPPSISPDSHIPLIVSSLKWSQATAWEAWHCAGLDSA